jgi:hypothetical protein
MHKTLATRWRMWAIPLRGEAVKKSRNRVTWLLPALLLVLAAPVFAVEAAADATNADTESRTISPEAKAVLDNMTAFMSTLNTFSVDGQSTRDEVVDFGFKLQHNEHVTLTAQFPNKLKSEISGGVRDRTFVYDGAKLVMYSPDDAAYSRVDAPDTINKLLDRLLGAGIEMPMIDVLFEASKDDLTEGVTGGVLVGVSNVDGTDCDHLAFRQPMIDWQLWVARGDKPLPRKVVITTRYDVGEPQYQVIMRWNLQPKIDASTFVFTPPKDTHEIPFTDAAAIKDAPPETGDAQ